MSPPISHHPQTSRQAKRDYQKKRLGSCLSESEKRRLARDVELHERAKRIRDNEQRRKLLLKQKEEKKEARRKAGLPESREEYISPRQQRLGAFVELGKRLREGNKEDEVQLPAGSPLQAKSVDVGSDGHFCSIAPARSPLQAKSVNIGVDRLSREATTSPQTSKNIDLDGKKVGLLHDERAENDAPPGNATSIVPERRTMFTMKISSVLAEQTSKVLELISTQDLQYSDEDDISSSSSCTLKAERSEYHEEGIEETDENDFADDELEELAQDIDFSSTVGLDLKPIKPIPSQKKKLPVTLLSDTKGEVIQASNQDQKEIEKDDNDKIFDEFAPSSQDLLNLEVEKSEDNFDDEFEITAQDIRALDP